MKVRFFVNKQAGIPQAIALEITDLGMQQPIVHSCHLHEYADGREPDDQWCKNGSTGPVVVTDGCRRPEVRRPPKGREWEVEGLQAGSVNYNKAVNRMWAEFDEFGDEELLP